MAIGYPPGHKPKYTVPYKPSGANSYTFNGYPDRAPSNKEQIKEWQRYVNNYFNYPVVQETGVLDDETRVALKNIQAEVNDSLYYDNDVYDDKGRLVRNNRSPIRENGFPDAKTYDALYMHNNNRNLSNSIRAMRDNRPVYRITGVSPDYETYNRQMEEWEANQPTPTMREARRMERNPRYKRRWETEHMTEPEPMMSYMPTGEYVWEEPTMFDFEVPAPLTGTRRPASNKQKVLPPMLVEPPRFPVRVIHEPDKTRVEIIKILKRAIPYFSARDGFKKTITPHHQDSDNGNAVARDGFKKTITPYYQDSDKYNY